MTHKKDDAKAEVERHVFAACIRAGGLALDAVSLESRKPPEPDIRCMVGGHPRRAEMVEITDPKLAARRAQAVKERHPTGGPFSDEDPLFYAVASKCEKNYKTDGEPLFLIAYYDKQYPTTPVNPEVIPSTIHGVAQAMVTIDGWSGLWVFDTWTQRVLWNYPKDVAARWSAT